ncbi:MAG: UDP-N-acetylmuramate dehydrogenase [Elusimicrobia bacterium]|nr:UDP-N-acetylmuramate dehydrogenase [Elusimicrobiota bacterium]
MRSRSDWKEEAAAAFPAARFNEPMRLHTTFKIGGPADCYLEASSEAGLKAVLRFGVRRRVPVFLLGGGSKLLVADAGIRGFVVRLTGDFEGVSFPAGGRAAPGGAAARVAVGAGVRVPKLLSFAAAKGLAGLEPLAGIPGTVGGALVMNAGTREGSIGDLVFSVRTLDPRTGRTAVFPRGRLRFGYRKSSLGRSVVVGCELRLKAASKVDIITRIREYQRRRSLTQPIYSNNIGSIFKNPPGLPAAKLIENCGLKGAVCGGARVSTKHSNFIENFSRASSADVLELVSRIRSVVRAAHGVDLELEMRVVGDA